MMLFWTLASVIGVCVGAGLPAAPSSTIHHDKKYYNLSTFQNNQEGAFDKYFINMDNAELRKGLSDTMVGAELMRPLFPFPFYATLTAQSDLPSRRISPRTPVQSQAH
jgi:hypothetical protein